MVADNHPMAQCVKYWQLTDLPLAVRGLSNIQTWQENVQVYVQSAKLKKDELQCAAKVLWREGTMVLMVR